MPVLWKGAVLGASPGEIVYATVPLNGAPTYAVEQVGDDVLTHVGEEPNWDGATARHLAHRQLRTATGLQAACDLIAWYDEVAGPIKGKRMRELRAAYDEAISALPGELP